MNKKGYTLVELLAVLAVMAIILLVAIPSVTRQISTIKNSKYNQFKQNVFLATESYINAKAKDFRTLQTSGGTACVNVSALVQDGWLKSSLNNPKTNSAISQNSSVEVTNKNGDYSYKYNPSKKC